MFGSIACSTQAIHDCHTDPLFRKRFSHHYVHFTLIKLPKRRIEIGGGFPEIPGWTQDDHLCEAGGDFRQRFAKCQERGVGLGKNCIDVRFYDNKFLFWRVVTRKTSRCIHKVSTNPSTHNMSILIQFLFRNGTRTKNLHRIPRDGEDR